MFESLEPKAPDAILKLIGLHRDDPRAEKIDLGVGVYRDEDGATPILSCVKKAEHWLVGTQSSKAYLGSRGDPVFCDDIERLIFGDDAVGDERISTVQSPGGSGALRVGAELMLRANPKATMWVSDPTWTNHVPLMGSAGVRLKAYPYYDSDNNNIRFGDMLEALSGAERGEAVLLHGCCHNPTGMDLDKAQWDQVADLVEARGLIPFIDLAYQGFAEGLEKDAYGVRLMYRRVPEMIVTQSCSKNFGLYRDRVGALTILAADADTAKVVDSQALSLVRTIYSLPPDHGAAVVSHILNDDALCAEWQDEMAAMRDRLTGMISLLVEELQRAAPDQKFY
ncbi:MAG: amino acid aminotransferase, partial [Pseudomonadota bacterium]|nr:amino acid aminotransferase [Pseudomonadota bacterium]